MQTSSLKGARIVVGRRLTDTNVDKMTSLHLLAWWGAFSDIKGGKDLSTPTTRDLECQFLSSPKILLLCPHGQIAQIIVVVIFQWLLAAAMLDDGRHSRPPRAQDGPVTQRHYQASPEFNFNQNISSGSMAVQDEMKQLDPERNVMGVLSSCQP
jgi:hypothetical protein